MKPITRKEIFENAIAQGKKPPIKPLTREEIIMAKEAERESSGGSSGGGAYATVDNKILRFDGNTEGRTVVTVENPEDPSQSITLIHVSDVVPTYEQMQAGGYYVMEVGTLRQIIEFNSDNVSDNGDFISFGEGCLIIKQDNTNVEGLATFPEAGIYFGATMFDGTLYSPNILVTKSETLSFGEVQYPKNSVVTVSGTYYTNGDYNISLVYDEMLALLSLGNLLVLTVYMSGEMRYFNLVASEASYGLLFRCAYDPYWTHPDQTGDNFINYIRISPTNEITEKSMV